MPSARAPDDAALNLAASIQFEQPPDYYTFRENINPQTGQVHRTYLYKRKQCYRVPVNSFLGKQIAGYTLIEKDLRSAIIWLKHCNSLHDEAPKGKNQHFGRGIDREKYNLVKGLMVAALTFYGKCFSQAEGRGIKLDRKQIGVAFREIHDGVVQLRNSFAAHSGDKAVEHALVVVVFPVDARQKVNPKLYRELFQPDHISSAVGEIQWLELFEHVQSVVNEKILKLSNLLESEEVFKSSREEWVRKAKNSVNS